MALHVPREDALSVLDGIGHRDMGKWNDEKIVAELVRIPESIEDDFELEGDDDLTLRDILAEIDGGSPQIIVGSSDDEDDGPEEDAVEPEAEADDAINDGDDGTEDAEFDEDEVKSEKAAERAEKKAAKEEAKAAKAEARAAKEEAKVAKAEARAAKKEAKAAEAAERKANKKLSLINAAAKVLEEEGRPMKCAEMIELAKERKYWTPGKGKTPVVTLAASIGTSIKNEKGRFKKTDKATYDLA